MVGDVSVMGNWCGTASTPISGQAGTLVVVTGIRYFWDTDEHISVYSPRNQSSASSFSWSS